MIARDIFSNVLKGFKHILAILFVQRCFMCGRGGGGLVMFSSWDMLVA